MKKHHGKMTKSVKSEMHGKGPGSNLKLKDGGQTIHVVQQKDKMAKNVSDHMSGPAGAEQEGKVKYSGGNEE